MGEQLPEWWSTGTRTAAPVAAHPVAPAAVPAKRTATKPKKEQAELAKTHDALFDVAVTAGGDETLVTPTLVSPDETLVNGLLASETYLAQLGLLARKPPQEQIRKALATLVDAGTLPVTALAQRVGLPPTRGDGFAAVLRQLLNYDGVQVLETLPDGRTLRLHTALLRDQFELR
ncbi:hypothetical protein ACFWD7_31665 [Streptomyces mirabilis]|uniref:hypothetical protein n=1 Tax=Streptomyces mirabilis TaxID=68239 RepID=UPI0028F714AF|nr:hypothetical protein [Streptomyces mirabilis]